MQLQNDPAGQPPARRPSRSCYLPKNKVVMPLKSDAYGYPQCNSWRKMLQSLRRRSLRFLTVEEHLINQTLNEFVSGIVSRLKLSIETYALGLYIYYSVVLRKLGYSSNQLLYASVSVYLASKVIERETNIVNISGLKKAACSYLNKEEYTKAQRTILQLLNYNLQLDTFISFVNAYLWRGVLYNDEGDFDIQRLVAFQQDVQAKCMVYVRNGRYLQYKPEQLAAYVVYHTRKAHGLSGWRKEFCALSEVSQTQMAELIESIKPIDVPGPAALGQLTLNTSKSVSSLVLQKTVKIAQSRVIDSTDIPKGLQSSKACEPTRRLFTHFTETKRDERQCRSLATFHH